MRLWLFLMLSLPWIAASAQNKDSIINYFGIEGTRWETAYLSTSFPEPYISHSYTKLEGREDIYGREAIKYWTSNDDGEPIRLLAYIAVEGDRVYYLLPNSTEWRLIYDFSIQPGESREVYGGSPIEFDISDGHDDIYKVTCKSIVQTDHTGISLMNLQIVPENDPNEDFLENITWIRGIGSQGGPLNNVYRYLDGCGSTLETVKLEGEIIYQISPTEIQKISTSSDNGNNIEIYDLQGRRVVNPDPRSIYISRGKKMVIK